MLLSGGEEQLESHLETLPNPPAVPVWRRYGQTHKGLQSFLHLSQRGLKLPLAPAIALLLVI